MNIEDIFKNHTGFDLCEHLNVHFNEDIFDTKYPLLNLDNKEAVAYPICLKSLITCLGKDFVPEIIGVYYLYLDKRIVYIGMSKNVRQRVLYHLKANQIPFTHIVWFPLNTIEDALSFEFKAIKYYKPPLNTVYLMSR